jgi:hypothetical protein
LSVGSGVYVMVDGCINDSCLELRLTMQRRANEACKRREFCQREQAQTNGVAPSLADPCLQEKRTKTWVARRNGYMT